MAAKPAKTEVHEEIVLNLPQREVSDAGSAGHGSMDPVVPALLKHIVERLDEMEKSMHKANAPAAGADAHALNRAMEDLAKKMESVGNSVLKHTSERIDGLAGVLAGFRQEVAARLNEFGKNSPGQATIATTTDSDGAQEWERIILGEDLCRNRELDAVRAELLDDLRSGVAEAHALAGQLMMVESASAEQMPELVKSVGEAYYAWRPRDTTDDKPLEHALVAWLTKRAEAIGLGNTIQLVRPGNRFDATRHFATERGVEITAVRGWVVLRNNGKVYTKARVSVK